MAATTTRTRRKKAPPRKRKREPWHGSVNGYSNHGCRCKACREAWAQYMADYRARRFSEQTVCSTKKCKNPVSIAAGNGLCYGCNEEING